MGTGMTAQESEWQPTAIDILGRCCDETAHIMTPERETTQSKTQSTSQVAKHTGVGGSGIAAPVQGITLTASPS